MTRSGIRCDALQAVCRSGETLALPHANRPSSKYHTSIVSVSADGRSTLSDVNHFRASMARRRVCPSPTDVSEDGGVASRSAMVPYLRQPDACTLGMEDTSFSRV
jgi:hypothetical protein